MGISPTAGVEVAVAEPTVQEPAPPGPSAAADSAAAWGEYERRLDQKGRVIVPQHFRAVLGDRYVVTRGPEAAIALVPIERWAAVEPLLEQNLRKNGMRSPYRVINSRTDVILDHQGRLTLPKYLRDWAALKPGDSVVVMGVGATIEIWNKQHWEEFLRNFTLDNVKAAARNIGLEGLLF